jgi:acetyl-CoA C-acetyltransferase
MAELFAPFTAVAAANPLAAVRDARSADVLLAVSDRKRMLTDLYPVSLVARDKVNLGAAVVLTSVGEARARGIPADRWVFLSGHAGLREQRLSERPDVSSSPAAARCVAHALEVAGIGMDAVELLDLYSCFPVAVSAIADPFGLRADDPRGLTVTGGLPFFGGPGNAYSLHAIAAVVEGLRERPGAHGLVWANGGTFSKHATGVYTSVPTVWRPDGSAAIQAEIAGWPALDATDEPAGDATVETFTIAHTPGGAVTIVRGRLADGRTFIANPGDPETAALFESEDAFGAKVRAAPGEHGNVVHLVS